MARRPGLDEADQRTHHLTLHANVRCGKKVGEIYLIKIFKVK